MVQMSVYFSKSLPCYSVPYCMCASWGPLWSLSIVYPIFPFSKLVCCLGSKDSNKMFEVLFLSSIFSIVIPQTVSLPKSLLLGPLLVFLTCMWVLSLLLLLDASGGRTETINGDFPSWSLDHMVSLVGERILLSSGTHLAATATTATGLKLQEWGSLKAKLR